MLKLLRHRDKLYKRTERFKKRILKLEADIADIRDSMENCLWVVKQLAL